MRRTSALAGAMPAYRPKRHPAERTACLALVAAMGVGFWAGAAWLASFWF